MGRGEFQEDRASHKTRNRDRKEDNPEDRKTGRLAKSRIGNKAMETTFNNERVGDNNKSSLPCVAGLCKTSCSEVGHCSGGDVEAVTQPAQALVDVVSHQVANAKPKIRCPILLWLHTLSSIAEWLGQAELQAKRAS